MSDLAIQRQTVILAKTKAFNQCSQISELLRGDVVDSIKMLISILDDLITAEEDAILHNMLYQEAAKQHKQAVLDDMIDASLSIEHLLGMASGRQESQSVKEIRNNAMHFSKYWYQVVSSIFVHVWMKLRRMYEKIKVKNIVVEFERSL